jgi:sugar phosphate isomerase/epimerase
MKLSCQENRVPGDSLAERLENLEAYGFEGIEFWGHQLWERESEIADELSRSPVKASSICAGLRGCLLDSDPKVREQAVEDLTRLLLVADTIGAVGVILVPIFGPPRLHDLSPLADARTLERDLLVELLKRVAEASQDVQTVLLLEPLNRYETHFLRTLDDGVDIAKRVGHPRVRVMADFFHMHIEETSTPAAIKRAGEYLWHVHLADNTRLLPGTGDTDFAAGFAALKSIGYDKYMALECGVPGDPAVELPKCAAYLKSLM